VGGDDLPYEFQVAQVAGTEIVEPDNFLSGHQQCFDQI